MIFSRLTVIKYDTFTLVSAVMSCSRYLRKRRSKTDDLNSCLDVTCQNLRQNLNSPILKRIIRYYNYILF